jgi:hypothetical protein
MVKARLAAALETATNRKQNKNENSFLCMKSLVLK